MPYSGDSPLARYNRLIKRNDDLYRQACRAMGIPEVSLWILYCLRESDIHTQSDLCDAMLQPKQSVNSALKRLEQDGYVTLSGSPGDKRSKRISLTEAGEKLTQRTADVVRHAEQAVFDTAPTQEQEQFLTLFDRFNDRLQKAMQQALQDIRSNV